ncbi:MAG: hypothetical protein SF162_01080 [bacterium]|nr:hypothetical protein [bacterium]
MKASEVFEQWYSELQVNFKSLTHPDPDLVSAVSNANQPIHRWYSLKEGFSSALPVWVVNFLSTTYNAKISRVIDPFVGGGTTGVSLALTGMDVDGIEYNPFIRFVSNTKSQYPRLLKADLLQAIARVDFEAEHDSIQLPVLTTLNNTQYFRYEDVSLMCLIIHQIRRLQIHTVVRDALLLGVAAAIDSVGHLRKDGRALRYAEKPHRPTAKIAIEAQWAKILEDVERFTFRSAFNVHHGSAVNLRDVAEDCTYDLALYSPPYLNNFDYSEIYKLELWMLDYISNTEDWRALRKSSLRSHPSINFDRPSVFDGLPEMGEIYAKLKCMKQATILTGESSAISKIVIGYFEDMYLALKEQWRILKPGGFLVYIVANSRHKYLPIATDVILGEIARQIGFVPLNLVTLKHRNGRTRQKKFLRETATILRKP